MQGQRFTIIFRGHNAFLCNEVALDFNQVALPSIAARKGFDQPASWIIKVLAYNRLEHAIFVEILRYSQKDEGFPAYQEKWFDELMLIEHVSFRNIDTTALLRMLSKADLPAYTYTPIELEPYHDDDNEPDEASLSKVSDDNKEKTNITKQKEEINPPPAKERVIEETFTVPIKHLQFKFGSVAFTKMLKGWWRSVDFEIPNYDIREEYDAVKNYFANALQTRNIVVQARIVIQNNEVIEKSAKSAHIDRIDQRVIDNVKFEFVKKSLKKKIQVEVDKSLFTMDEYFDTFTEEKPKAGALFKDEYDLLENLMHITNTKHYKNLRYLSAKHAHHIMKLRFVHKPFSFIFLLEGKQNYHIIWETLDTTEATWIWHSEKNITGLKNTVRKVEDIINVVKVQGKTGYINTNEDPFRRVFHDYSDLVEGFVKWKGQLESYLT